MMNNELTPYKPQEGPLDLVAVRLDSNKYPRLKNLPAPVGVSGLAQIIAAALAYAGKSPPEEDVRFMAGALHTELMQDYNGVGTANIALDEVQYCIRRATLGLGPEMYGINVSSLYKVVCDYCLHEGRQAQETANSRSQAQRRQALKSSPAGAMLESYAGRMLKSQSHNSQDK